METTWVFIQGLSEPSLSMTAFELNGRRVVARSSPGTPLLWVIREEFRLSGTKYGCGLGQCGACTIHLDGAAVRSCQVPLAAVEGKRVATIEGLSSSGSHALQDAWVAEQVPQCGYCQAGQIMAAAALLRHTPRPTDDDIERALEGNLCRCGTYLRIRRAIHRAAGATG
jgi:aerobic-type carbon monoxide dehydrogenase small subunit (CoxS/CutS family)